MAIAAIPMTIVMILQAILMMIGAGFGDGATDVDSDYDIDDSASASDASSCGNSSVLRIFTVRGIVAFFALGGWAGLAAITAGIPPLWSIQIALLAGVAALLVAAVVMRLVLRMQSSGNLDLRNAISHTGDVYITIPPLRSRRGKITMLLQERFVELDAVTDSTTAIKPKTKVEVIGLDGIDCLVVRPVMLQDLEKNM